MIMSKAATLSKKALRDELWRRAELSFKLDPNQQSLRELYYRGEHKLFTWLLARRNGKSFTLVVLAIEQCLRKPNSIVKYAAPTKQQINMILRPIFRKILEDCPEDLKPIFKTNDFIYYFPNGSEIQLAGTDNNHAEKLRGGDSDLSIVDEAGFCSDLFNLIKSILLPTTLMTNGKIILASTPPKEEDHDFIHYIEEADMRGSLVKKTIFDNPRLTDAQRDELIKELGGLTTDEARRELLCELIKSTTTSVIPEFNEDLRKKIVKEWPRPPFYDCYESMDVGGVDFTAVLFAYYDFRADKIIVEDEIVIDFQQPGNNLEVLTNDIIRKEEKLWTNALSGELKKPTLRVSDTNPIALNEIRKYSHNKVSFMPTRKDDKDTALNNFRVLLKAEKIIIHPRCVNFIRHLTNVRWKNKTTKNDFARSPDNGHYDTVPAGIYLVRNINFKKNPYPAHYDINLRSQDAHIDNIDSTFSNKTDVKSIYKKIFNIKGRLNGR